MRRKRIVSAMARRGGSALSRYAVAVAATGLVLLIRLALEPELGERSAFVLSTLAVMASAWWGGLGPGLLAMVASAAGGLLLFLGSDALKVAALVQTGLFLVAGTGISWLAEKLLAARRAAEMHAKQARVAQQKIENILDSISDGFQALDDQFRLVYVNRAAERAMGVRGGQVVGQRVWDVCPPLSSPAIEGRLRKVLADRASAHFEAYDEPGQRWFDFHASPAQGGGMSLYFRDISERKRAEREREKLIEELQAALAKVKVLSGLLPICAGCKKIRDDQGYWHQVETFIARHSEAEFSHGYCPECVRRYFPEFDEENHARSAWREEA